MFCNSFGFHDWEKWKLINIHQMTKYSYGKDVIIGERYAYQRQCNKCGKVQHKLANINF